VLLVTILTRVSSAISSSRTVILQAPPVDPFVYTRVHARNITGIVRINVSQAKTLHFFFTFHEMTNYFMEDFHFYTSVWLHA